jgi:hypothetical protein
VIQEVFEFRVYRLLAACLSNSPGTAGSAPGDQPGPSPRARFYPDGRLEDRADDAAVRGGHGSDVEGSS